MNIKNDNVTFGFVSRNEILWENMKYISLGKLLL